MKVIKSSTISPFGGLNFVLDSLKSQGIGKLLNEHLPALPNQSKYTWQDILYTFWSIYFCGGDCIEDCAGNFGRYISDSPYLKVCSPDRILDRFKELAQPKEYPTTARSKQLHEFSINLDLNRLSLKISKRCGLAPSSKLVLDYDNTMIYNTKADSARTYLKANGYCPGVGAIGSKIVYVENRNGNSGAHTNQVETLNRMFSLLKEENFEIDRFRADSASYQFEVVRLLDRAVNKFYLRARRTRDLAAILVSIKDWEEIRIGTDTYFRGEALYKPFKRTAKRIGCLDSLKTYRIVVTKCYRRDKQIDLFTNEACNYSIVMTNDFELSADEIVDFYNQRGKAENEFDVLKNDFGWNRMPFSKLEQNTVFLIFSAICRNIYDYIISTYSNKYKRLKSNFRIKKFIFRFIVTPAKWISRSRQKTLVLYGSIDLRGPTT